MSESSLPSFEPSKLRLLLRAVRLKEVLGGLLARPRRGEVGPAQISALESRAAQSIREYLDAHAANLERVVRLGERAERLEKAGIPSESARNRAERAREEMVAGLATLRASFVEAAGERESVHVFDRAVELLCPDFMP